MEVQIKKAIKAGNSSAVILPRSWLDKEVRIEPLKKTSETILMDVIEITRKYINLKNVIGIYLTGSYARGEEDKNSDIDILVITDDIDKEIINEGLYNILIISSKLLKQKLNQDLFPIGQMIKEAKPLLNSYYLDSIEVNITKKNIKWYLDTTEDKLKIIRKVLHKMRDKNKRNISDLIAYTLVLRIKTLYIIKKLIKDQDYSKRDFIKLIKKITKGTSSYERYLAVKNNLEDKKRMSIEDSKVLYEYLENQLTNIKKDIK